MTQAFGLTAALVIFWALLSGYWLPLILALGVGSIALCVYLAHRLDVADHEGHPIHLTFRALAYYPWLIKEIIVSNVTVASAIIRGDVHPQVLKVNATQKSDLGLTTYANSITLTPGTITIATVGPEFVVHALMDETADGLRSGEMDAKVCDMMIEKEDVAAALNAPDPDRQVLDTISGKQPEREPEPRQ